MFTFLSSFSAPTLALGENIVNWYQNSFLKELLDALNAQYFSVELGLYENFSVTPQTAATVRDLREKKLAIPCFDTSYDLSSDPNAVATLTELIGIAKTAQVKFVVACALTDNEAAVGAALEQ